MSTATTAWVDEELGLEADPLRSFAAWYTAAERAEAQPEAMALATVGADGQPAVRMVLYRGLEDGGLRFFTNYDSPKGRELAIHARAALLFYWQSLRRQVRVEGPVEPLSAASSDTYFASRDRESQLGAWASHQSAPLPSREVLLERMESLRGRFAGQVVPRPPLWGGYRLLPQRFEFWQNRPSRLHDRFCYDLAAHGWRAQRLSP